ncbi:MAG: methyl-accepting chemotaxis protein [Burkholderiaceae bacterium]
MKLATKLLAAPLLTAVVLLAAGQANTWMMGREAAANQAASRSDLEHFRVITSAQEQIGRVHAGVYRSVALIASLDDAKIKAYRSDLALQTAAVKRVVASAVAQNETDEQLRAAIARSALQIDKYLKQADEAIDLSSVDPNTGIAALQGADASFNNLAGTLAAMATRIEAHAQASVEASNARRVRTAAGLSLAGLLAAALAVAGSWWMQRRLVAELRRAARIADAVATGTLGVDAHSERRDELGDVLRSLGAMAQQLNHSMNGVLASARSIRESSSEIASGNLDLSTRTEQTAGNLQRAVTALLQLTGNVNQSAQASRRAHQLAQGAAEVASRGGVAVAQVVDTMNQINTSSKRIADIVGVIDSIAFQTNILALNAAVEAARAGEQGRGFAVVASEVRSLAQRSAQAAKEIAGLIGVSVEKVESGSKQVGKAGQTMQEIVKAVQDVSSTISQISSAAAEQAGGIEQVNASVDEVERMTQQNAALVEQSAAAAESLQAQSKQLSEAVAVFTLDDAPPAPGEPAPDVPGTPAFASHMPEAVAEPVA